MTVRAPRHGQMPQCALCGQDIQKGLPRVRVLDSNSASNRNGVLLMSLHQGCWSRVNQAVERVVPA